MTDHDTNADQWLADQPTPDVPPQCDAYWWGDRCYRDAGHPGRHVTDHRGSVFHWAITDESDTNRDY